MCEQVHHAYMLYVLHLQPTAHLAHTHVSGGLEAEALARLPRYMFIAAAAAAAAAAADNDDDDDDDAATSVILINHPMGDASQPVPDTGSPSCRQAAQNVWFAQDVYLSWQWS